MITRAASIIGCAVALIAIAHPATASAKRNPYTAEQVCGAGFYKIDKHRLYSGSSHTTLLAATFLLYNGASGKNCAVTMKRRFIGTPTTTGVSLKVKGKKRAWVVDQDAYKSAAFIQRNLPKDSNTEQAWQFLGASLRTYCPDKMPVLEAAAQH